MRGWVDSSWHVGWRTLPVPGVAFGGMLLPGQGDAEWVLGLLLSAVASLLLVARALHVSGWTWPPGTLPATAAGLLGTVAVALVLASRVDEPDTLLACTVLALPHVALAGLAWPGWQGLTVRVAVATAAVVPGAFLGALSGYLTFLVLGPVSLALGVAVGHLLVLFAGTAVARPVALRGRVPLQVPLPASALPAAPSLPDRSA